jgi:hypothetical protein
MAVNKIPVKVKLFAYLTFLDFIEEVSDTEDKALEVTDVLGWGDGDFRGVLVNLRRIRIPGGKILRGIS